MSEISIILPEKDWLKILEQLEERIMQYAGKEVRRIEEEIRRQFNVRTGSIRP